MNSPTNIVISRVLGVGRTERQLFVSASDVADYVAALGPVERKDRAGGFPHPYDPQMMLIPIGHCRCTAVDTDDYALVKGYAWHITPNGYVEANDNDARHLLRLHRLVMMVGPSSSLVIDHKDGDPLNNRKVNLRSCTQAQNTWNSQMSSRNTSGFKGVSRNGKRWRGTVEANGVSQYKNFDTKEEANEWARSKRIELHGAFVCHGQESAIQEAA